LAQAKSDLSSWAYLASSWCPLRWILDVIIEGLAKMVLAIACSVFGASG